MNGFDVTINNKKYYCVCNWTEAEKIKNDEIAFGVKISIMVKDISLGRWLYWKEIKDTYLAEKLLDFIKNTINGQRSFYYISQSSPNE